MRRKYSDAEAHARAVAARLSEATTSEEADRLTREYVKARYFLNDEDLSLESFNALGQMSIARLAGISPEEALRAETSSKCEGASPSMTKKILLMMGLNRDVGLGISPEEAAEITTISSLAEYVSEVIATRNAGG